VRELSSAQIDERFLVLAPTGRDARLTRELLAGVSIDAVECVDMDALCRRHAEGAAGILIAQEALRTAALERLVDLLSQQESWSDLPIIVFLAQGDERTMHTAAVRMLSLLGNVTLLERPVRPITMVGAARAALRARRRQYQARAVMMDQARAVTHRDRFLAMLGHELRNPLGAIQLGLEMIETTAAPTKWTAILRRQTGHLTRLVDDLLDVSRVTSGKIVLHRRKLDLCEMVRDTIQAFSPAVQAQSLQIDAELPPSSVDVEGDPVRLEQVLTNLVTNAVKYTRAGGHVRITVARKDADAVLVVADSGLGIAPEMLPHIFDVFAQAPGTLDRARGGLGIGLTVARSLAELHGGSLEAKSEGLGRGSTFTLRLPLAEATESEALVAATPVANGRSQRIVVVEDHVDSRELLQTVLEAGGHQVRVVGDGRSAVEEAVRSPPDAMVIDIGLPELDGYGVARAVRRALGSAVYLVALTGYGQPDDREQAADAGFDAHFTKPVDPRALLGLLSRTKKDLELSR
jgi:signal transduction histidine kinase/ActR/RegA family two-component response regulator